MSDRFPLLKLPYLCIVEVLSNFQIAELIPFSIISETVYSTIKSMRFPIKQINIDIKNELTIIRFKASENVDIGSWHIREDCPNPNEFSRENLNNEWPINRVPLYFRYSNDGTGSKVLCYCPNGYRQQICKSAIKHVMNLFRSPPINKVAVYTEKLDEKIFPRNIGIKTCLALHIIDEKPLEEQVLCDLLKSMDVRDAYSFRIPIQNGIPIELGTKKVECTENQEWITRDVLFSFKYDELHCLAYLKQLRANDVIELVYRWFVSDNKTFRMFLLKLKNGVEEHYFDDLNAMEWSPERRSRCYPVSPRRAADLSKGRDIERSDGLLATVFYHRRTFFFCVWHERFNAADGRKNVFN
uniref:F-box domain-containing protein n=2 Tax=Caenorhabditis tropicalis TaxID=1561998 RepID=A0A1I7T7R7_9PELO